MVRWGKLLLPTFSLDKRRGTFIPIDNVPIVLIVVPVVLLWSTLLPHIPTVPVTLIHPDKVVGVPNLTTIGSNSVPVILRGTLKTVFNGRVTLRIMFKFIPENVTFVTHRVMVTLPWVLVPAGLKIVALRQWVTTLTVPTLNTLSTL